MADKAISELIAAQKVFPGDMFVLEQDGTAKKLTGQTLENWLLSMADGHGGIHAIEKLSSKGLVDTYRMTFADTTTFDYIITNGKGIADIKYGFKDGLIDHYNVLFNDGTTFSYTVTNGAKGDKGDAWYVWFKYASQKPTDASHSIGDVPDNWIGIYSGTAPAAPADWKQYQWFQYKGQKGDTGDPAVLLSSKTEYQTSTSGTVQPSGQWSEDIPAIQQGSYLWTRTTKTFNSGAPVVDYTVGYIGKDGTVSFEELTDEQKEEVKGGHYTPVVTQPNADTMQMAYIPSKDDLPSVDPVNITLPAGPAGKDGKNYVLTEADRTAIAAMAQKNVPAPDKSGDATPKSYVDTLGLVTATHGKTGTAHALVAPAGCGNLKFVAAAPYEDGDTITLNGVAVTAKTQDGEALTGGAWAAGAVVMCLVSPDGGTLFFRGGGGGVGKSEIIVTAPSGCTVTATCGSITKRAAEKAGTWTVRGCGVGEWTLTATHRDQAKPATGKVTITEKYQLMRYYIELSFVKIYGIERDVTNPSPEWTRTDESAGFTASASVGTVAGRSDFDNCMPWKGMQRVTLDTGDVMVKIPAFWFQRYKEGNVEKIRITENEEDGFKLHPAFDRAGKQYDCIYVGAYKTSANNRSVPDAAPQASQSRSTMRGNAEAKGQGWSLMDISALSAIQMLFLAEFASYNSQLKIGQGYVSASAAIKTGSCDLVPNLTGRPAGTDGNTDIVYRGLEGIWGNLWDWIDGINVNDGTYYVCNDPLKFSDEISDGYEPLSFSGSSGWNESYITVEGVDDGSNSHVMLPAETGGSSSEKVCDAVWLSYGLRAPVIGGGWYSEAVAGLFAMDLDIPASTANPYNGARLLYLPS